MSTKEELEAAVTVVSDKIGEVSETLTDFAVDFRAAVDELKAQITAGQDLTASVSALATLADKASAVTAALKTLDVEAETISGKPTPPPEA